MMGTPDQRIVASWVLFFFVGLPLGVDSDMMLGTIEPRPLTWCHTCSCSCSCSTTWVPMNKTQYAILTEERSHKMAYDDEKPRNRAERRRHAKTGSR
jgi:hypothetical protein